MSEENRNVLSELQEKLYTLAYLEQDEFTEDQLWYLKRAWCNVYGILNDLVQRT